MEELGNVSPLVAPNAGVKELQFPMVGGATVGKIQADPLCGASDAVFDADQRLAVGVRRLLRQINMQTLSLRQVGPCLLQCVSLCCKPSSMAGEFDHFGFNTSSADTVPDGAHLQVWGQATSLALMDMAGESMAQQPNKTSILQRAEVKKSLERQLERFDVWDETTSAYSFDALFRSKGVDYTGEMVKLAQPLQWQAVANSLPEGVGKLNLEDFCVAGTRHYVLNFEEYMVPLEDQVPPRAPRVQVEEGSWDDLCRGLLDRGICDICPFSELHIQFKENL